MRPFQAAFFLLSFSIAVVVDAVIIQQPKSSNLLDDAVSAFVRNAKGQNIGNDGDSVPDNIGSATRLWAVLVAGSNSWWNYRHQADICHAYQIMKRHGIPDERIVVMMYDDLAFSDQNPTPGIVINKPNGTDVYHGVLKDYKGDDVTPQNFLNVIQGKKASVAEIGSGKVLQSGPNDHVFINFADHGAPGLIAFPNDVLYATDLIKALQFMSDNKMFQKLVLYIEACEAGSMFDKILPANISVYAATASNPDESSYACYYDDKLGTYLGDVFSVNWMEDSDAEDIETETIAEQIIDVKAETTTSHVTHYGDVKISKLDVGQFQGLIKSPYLIPRTGPRPVDDAVTSEDVPMQILVNRLALSGSESERQHLAKQLDDLHMKRNFLRSVVAHIMLQLDGMTTTLYAQIMNTRQHLTDHACARAATDAFRTHCFGFARNEYALRMIPKLVNACELGVPQATLVDTIQRVCHIEQAHSVTGIL